MEAKLFAQEGAKVVFGDILDAEGRQVEAAIRQAGGEATYVHLDVTQEADWQEAVQTAVATYGKLDVLVNNAGILRRDGIEETTKELWDTILAVNATGVFLGTKYAIPEMRKAGGGSIVNISSISGMVALGGPAYNASKGRRAGVHEGDGRAPRRGQHSLQFRPSGAGAHPHDREHVWRPGDAGAALAIHAAGPYRHV